MFRNQRSFKLRIQLWIADDRKKKISTTKHDVCCSDFQPLFRGTLVFYGRPSAVPQKLIMTAIKVKKWKRSKAVEKELHFVFRQFILKLQIYSLQSWLKYRRFPTGVGQQRELPPNTFSAPPPNFLTFF